MQKRPLCLAAILLVLALWILPKDVWLAKPDIPSGELLTVTGTVTKREQKEEQQVYYLKDCLCTQTNSEFSMLAYIPKGITYPVGCEHITGMQQSGIIISINTDPDAPINAIADYVITGRIEEVLPKLITFYQQKI